MAFIITIPVADLPHNQQQLSYQFILLPTKTIIPPQDLYSKDLWIVTCDNGEGYLWCRLSIIAIEEIRDGDNLECYLLSGDVDRSEYFARASEKLKPLRVDSMAWFDAEALQKLTQISHDQEQALKTLVTDFIQIKLVKPSAAIVEHLWRPTTKHLGIDQFKSIVQQLKLKYTISELYRYNRHPSYWSPYESFAFSYVEQKFSTDAKTLTLSSKSSASSEAAPYERTVDTVMRDLDPNRVRIRKYVNPPEIEIDTFGLDTYLKTERADSVHQAMLADLANRIIKLGQHPQESNSIDLFTEGAGSSLLIEIKSASEATFYRQCTKGAMQALEYAYCLKTHRGTNCKPVLVLQSIENDALKEYVSGLLGYLGITLLIYEGRREWPGRVPGFDSLIHEQKQA